LGELGKPTLFVWGKQDVSFPYSNASKAAVLVPQAEIVGIDGAAHWVNIEQADKTNAAVLAFLAE
jgi:pimeloyl-ACP methyl ester carboxylesterase